MSYFQRHLRHYEGTDNKTPPASNLQQVALKNKKMNCQRIKTQHSSHHSKYNRNGDENGSKSQVGQRNSHERRKNARLPVRFATEEPCSNQYPDQSMKVIFAEADNSMEQMLNSSANHFQKFLKSKERVSDQNSQLIEQNQQLKQAVEELMTILRSKLDKALRKQEQQLKGVMADYLQLITKLLGDKQQLTSILQGMQAELKRTNDEMVLLQQHLSQMEERQGENRSRWREMEGQMSKLRQELEQNRSEVYQQKISGQNKKTQTLYEMLQRSEEEKKQLQQKLMKLQNGDQRYRKLQEDYEMRLTEKQRQFEDIFEQYDKVMKEAISHKDNTISRLSRMGESRVTNQQNSD